MRILKLSLQKGEGFGGQPDRFTPEEVEKIKAETDRAIIQGNKNREFYKKAGIDLDNGLPSQNAVILQKLNDVASNRFKSVRDKDLLKKLIDLEPGLIDSDPKVMRMIVDNKKDIVLNLDQSRQFGEITDWILSDPKIASLFPKSSLIFDQAIPIDFFQNMEKNTDFWTKKQEKYIKQDQEKLKTLAKMTKMGNVQNLSDVQDKTGFFQLGEEFRIKRGKANAPPKIGDELLEATFPGLIKRGRKLILAEEEMQVLENEKARLDALINMNKTERVRIKDDHSKLLSEYKKHTATIDNALKKVGLKSIADLHSLSPSKSTAKFIKDMEALYAQVEKEKATLDDYKTEYEDLRKEWKDTEKELDDILEKIDKQAAILAEEEDEDDTGAGLKRGRGRPRKYPKGYVKPYRPRNKLHFAQKQVQVGGLLHFTSQIKTPAEIAETILNVKRNGNAQKANSMLEATQEIFSKKDYEKLYNEINS